MNGRLGHLLQEWALRDWDADSEVFLDQAAVQYLGQKAYDDYEPSQFDRFEDRLDRWLHNMDDDDDRLTLFKLLSRLFFIGRPEFESLCRAAFHGPVTRWIANECAVDIADPAAMDIINAGVQRTWFCPITDSMRISSFLKVNQLNGHSHRPDWRSLRKFGEPAKVISYIKANQIDRIVLLEDFVGSGTQMKSAVKFAAELSDDIKTLACPLVTCPGGDETGLELQRTYANITYEPVMRVAPGMLIKPDPQTDEPELYAKVRDLIVRVRDRLGPTEADEESKRHHGFRGTGAVISMYSNCPNNSLPIIYDETPEWDPLFPRIKRQ